MVQFDANSANLINRAIYIKKIKNFINKPVIKVLVGMRRVGKSSLIKLLIGDLIKSGVPEHNIVYINKESLLFDDIKNYKDLFLYVTSILKEYGNNSQKYIFIDEIQEIHQWEKAVASLHTDNAGDIIITGSNANILSLELSTLISGRYITIPIYPLTFNEYLTFRKNYDDTEKEFQLYIRYGGLPAIHYLDFNDDIVFTFLNSILDTVIYKDIIGRYKIRDAGNLDKIIRYLFDNIGNITTAKKISDYFKAKKVKVSVDTVLNYMSYIETSLLIDKVQRYDVRGKKILEYYDKIYLNDIGLRHGLIGYREQDIGSLLENIVYHELKARGYAVKVGVCDNYEIDFIAEKQNDKKYYQVCYLLQNEKLVEREFGNLKKIKDNYEKIVVSMDRFYPDEMDGIQHKYVIDFLMEGEKG